MNGLPIFLWLALLCAGMVAFFGVVAGWAKQKAQAGRPNQKMASMARWMPIIFGAIGLNNLAVYMGKGSLFEAPRSFLYVDVMGAVGLYFVYVLVRWLVEL